MSKSSIQLIGWQPVNNKCLTDEVNEEWYETTKEPRRMKPRTKILNRELKNFSQLKSYSQYVKMKTNILRNFSDNEEYTDNELRQKSSDEEEETEKIPLIVRTKRRSVPSVASRRHKNVQSNRSKSKEKEKNERNAENRGPVIKDIKVAARAKRNLTKLLDNVENTSTMLDKQVKKIGDTVADVEPTESKKASPTKVSIAEKINGHAPGDSGIDEDSQDNSSGNAQENENPTRFDKVEETIGNSTKNDANARSQGDEWKEATDDSMDDTPPLIIDENSVESFDAPKSSEDNHEKKAEDKHDYPSENESVSLRVHAPRDGGNDSSAKSEDQPEQKSSIPHGNLIGGSEVISESDDDEETAKNTETSPISSEYRAEKKPNLKEVDSTKIKRDSESPECSLPSSGDRENKYEAKTDIASDSESSQSSLKDAVEDKFEPLTQKFPKSEAENSIYTDTENSKDSSDEDEKLKMKPHPVIMSTEIVMSKYKIIRDDNDEVSEISSFQNPDAILDEEVVFDRKSPNSQRVSQMKRLNLTCSDSESESSDDDNDPIRNQVKTQILTKSSQMISNFSDSDHDDSRSSDSFDISDVESEIPKKGDEDREKKVPEAPINVGTQKKSIKSQIEHQVKIAATKSIETQPLDNGLEEDDKNEKTPEAEEKTARENEASEEVEKNDQAPKEVKKTKAGKKNKDKNDEPEVSADKTIERQRKSGGPLIIGEAPTETQSLQFVLKNISHKSADRQEFDLSRPSETRDQSELPEHEEKQPRPIELGDFVARQGLVSTGLPSTINNHDLSFASNSERSDDEEIWLMEFPKSIFKKDLHGHHITLEESNMRIGETDYDTVLRHDSNLSCIVRSSKKKERYKTVNIKPTGSIVIRKKSTKKESSRIDDAVGERTTVPASVPFPTNLKTRNPLATAENLTSCSTKKRRRNSGGKNKNEKVKKRTKRIWDIDNFISKSKKRKIDFPLAGKRKVK